MSKLKIVTYIVVARKTTVVLDYIFGPFWSHKEAEKCVTALAHRLDIDSAVIQDGAPR